MDPEQWYYSNSGQSLGPISPGELRSLAFSGTLSKDDLVWSKGLADWVPAGSVKSLFPPAASVSLPKTAPPLPPDLGTRAGHSNTNNEGSQLGYPALWNPRASICWSLVFTPAFGAWLMAKNWTMLGEEQLAKQMMLWFWGTLVGLLSWGFLIAAVPPITRLQPIWLAVFLAWVLSTANHQEGYVKSHFGKSYHHKEWMSPLFIGLAAMAGFLLYAGVCEVVFG